MLNIGVSYPERVEWNEQCNVIKENWMKGKVVPERLYVRASAPRGSHSCYNSKDTTHLFPHLFSVLLVV